MAEPEDLSVCLIDSTCLPANVHFPVDWVLLRDVCLTLLKAVVLIRREGLLHRMPETPEEQMRAMNKLCIEMTHSRRKAGAKKARKAVLRKMKKLLRRIGERQIKNADKILSSHKPDIDVIVRGKAGAQVEFGNELFLAERLREPQFHRWQTRRGATTMDRWIDRRLVSVISRACPKSGVF